jgi:hypothetical protein
MWLGGAVAKLCQGSLGGEVSIGDSLERCEHLVSSISKDWALGGTDGHQSGCHRSELDLLCVGVHDWEYR